MSDIRDELGLRRYVNLCGAPTVYGGFGACAEAIEAAARILPLAVDIADLQRVACETIAAATGADAGCVTGCAAAGVAIAVAACMTGSDLAAIGRLPDARGLRRRVVMQRAHDFNCGATARQLVALPGARLVMVGSARSCSPSDLGKRLDATVAAGLFVLGDLDAPRDVLDLRTFAALCQAAGVPVIVDAAAQHGLGSYVEDGADLFIRSAQKVHAGLTAGIIAGRLDLIRACLLQERGIGRPMKAGKEGVVGAIAALRRWRSLDESARRTAWDARCALALDALRVVRGLRAMQAEDPLGNQFARVRIDVDPARAGINAWELARELKRGDPGIVVWDYDVDRGFILLDPRPCTDADMTFACQRIRAIIDARPSSAVPIAPPAVGHAAYDRALLDWPIRPDAATA